MPEDYGPRAGRHRSADPGDDYPLALAETLPISSASGFLDDLTDA